MEKKKSRLSQAMVFLILFGIVSLFSDMTHEGASSIRGAYLALLGASAGTIGFISGLGELIGYSMRYIFGRITDRTRSYWPMTILGYVLDIIAVPALGCWWGEHGLDCRLYAAGDPAHGQGHQKTSKGHHHVLCRRPRREPGGALASRNSWIRSAPFWGRCCCGW